MSAFKRLAVGLIFATAAVALISVLGPRLSKKTHGLAVPVVKWEELGWRTARSVPDKQTVVDVYGRVSSLPMITFDFASGDQDYVRAFNGRWTMEADASEVPALVSDPPDEQPQVLVKYSDIGRRFKVFDVRYK